MGDVGAPDRKVVLLVINERGDAAVRVEFRELGRFLLALAEVEVDGLVREPEQLEQIRDFPVGVA